MEERTYRHDGLCNNCKSMIWWNIPRGTTVVKYLKENRICPSCGCEHEVED